MRLCYSSTSQTPDSWWGSVQMGNHSHKSHVDPFLAFLMLCASLALRLTLALPSFPSVSCSPCLRPLLLPLQIYKMTPYLSARNLPLPEVEQLLYVIIGILCSLFCEMTGVLFVSFAHFSVGSSLTDL